MIKSYFWDQSDLYNMSIVEVHPASDPGLEEEGGVMSAVVAHYAH